MSWEEKRSWVYLLTCLGAYAWYLAQVWPTGGIADVDGWVQSAYVSPLIWSIGISIAANIVLSILAAIIDPEQADRSDERDASIHQRGDLVGFHVTSVLLLVPWGLTMAEHPHFFIANGIYLAFLLGAVVSAVAKLYFYRRGYISW